jgi:hypothetical protein
MARGRRPDPALTLAAISLVAALAIAAYAALRVEGSPRNLVLATSGAGLLLLLLARLLGRAGLLGWGVLLLGAGYAETLFPPTRPTDLWAPLVGAGLLVTAELAYWSLQERGRYQGGRDVNRRRALTIGLVAVAGLALGVLALGSSQLAGGPLIAAPAVLCVMALCATVAALAWR